MRHCGEPLGAYLPVEVLAAGGCVIRTLKQCRNRFVDPYCSGWFRSALAGHIATVVTAAHDDGCTAALVVTTAQHRRGQSLAAVLELQRVAWAQMRRGRRWRESGLAWLNVLDVVVGGPNGPHPHGNLVAVAPAGFDWDEFRTWLREAWPLAVGRAALKLRTGVPVSARAMRAHGSRVTVIGSGGGDAWAVGRYAARDVEGAGFEAVDDRWKRSAGGFSLLDLACMAHAGQDDAGRLLAACSADLEGRKSWTASHGWADLGDGLGVERPVEDDADADAVLVGRWLIGWLRRRAYVEHRERIDALLDLLRGADLALCMTAWRQLAADGVGVTVLDEPEELEP